MNTAMQQTNLRFTAPDGIALAAHAIGDPAGKSVLLLHGGGQTRHSWNEAAEAIARAGGYAVTLDLRGHGESDWAAPYAMEAFMGDMETVVAFFDRPPAIVGASLGGIVALLATGSHRISASALVLVDIALRSEPAGVERILSFMEGTTGGFDSLEAAADAIAAYLPHRKRPQNLDGLAKNLRRRDDGRYYWHWDPAMIEGMELSELRERGEFERAARGLTIPVLLVRGAKSDVLSEEIAREFLAIVPQARYVDVRGATHMVAGDENDAFTSAILNFIFERTAA
jgi:pimeloyl-ACP methyl ester carboxylesterase